MNRHSPRRGGMHLAGFCPRLLAQALHPADNALLPEDLHPWMPGTCTTSCTAWNNAPP